MIDRLTQLQGVTRLTPHEHYQAVLDALTILRDNTPSPDGLLRYLFTGEPESLTYVADYISRSQGYYSQELSDLLSKVKLGQAVRVILDAKLQEGVRIDSQKCLQTVEDHLAPCIILPETGSAWLILDTGDPIVDSRLIFEQSSHQREVSKALK